MGRLNTIVSAARVRGSVPVLAVLLSCAILSFSTTGCGSTPSVPDIPDIPLPTVSRELLPQRDTPVPTPVASDTSPPAGAPMATPNASATPAPTANGASVLVPRLTIAEVPENLPVYSRSEWKHWVDPDGDCQNTRAEVLIEESTADPVFASERHCRVTGGRWNGPYTGQTFTDAGDLDIDHLVPLKNAHQSGGWQWNEGHKEDYANSMAADFHLIAVDKSANRAKGAKGPEEWQPPDPAYLCEYAYYWIAVKAAWELTATAAEWEALEQMLALCPVTVEIVDDASVVMSPPDVARLREELGLSRTDGAATLLVATATPEPFSGSLVISEIMPDPSAVRDAAGEWFEIYNPDSEQAVNLDGWTIGDGDGDLHRISGTVELPSGGYVVLARNSDSTANGGIAADYQYQDFALTNSGDSIVLMSPAGRVIDRVEYNQALVFPGASTSLDLAALNSAGNDDHANWCRSSSGMPNGDYGTPGEANNGC